MNNNNDLLQELDIWADVNYPNEEILIMNGFEEAFLGVAVQFDKHIPIFCKNKCISILMDQDMSYEDAVEFFDFNVQNAWHGENTPAFLDWFEYVKKENNAES